MLGAAAIGVLLSGLTASGAAAGSSTYYASPSSTDTSGACTQAAPCRLDHAVALATAGDTVIVTPGTYSITYPVSTSAAITIEGQAGQAVPDLVGSSSLTGDTLAVSGGATVRNLMIETQSLGNAALSIDGGLVEDVKAFSSPTGGGGIGLIAKDSSAGTTIRSVLAYTRSSAGYAILLEDGAIPGSVTLLNDTAVAETSSTTAIYGQMTSGTAEVKNTIAAGSSNDVIGVKGSQPIGLTSSDFVPGNSTGYADQSGNVSTPPIFVDGANADYHEATGSPTIDAGTSDPNLPSTDLDGNPRTLGVAPDIGSYEYVPGSGQTAQGGQGSNPQGNQNQSHGNSGGHGSAHLPPATIPVPGKSVTARLLAGKVLIKLPHGRKFLGLTVASQVPVGSTINASHGEVLLRAAVNHSGLTKTGTFSGGSFQVEQTRGARPFTALRLVGGSFAGCAITHAPRFVTMLARHVRRHRVVRQLWGRDHGGRFKTIGRTASATVRGTVWLTQDRCDGTLVRVRRGHVLVRDDRRHRNVLVGPGHSYLAHAR